MASKFWNPVSFQREGLTVMTNGLAKKGFPEILVRVGSSQLIGQGEAFLKHVADYMRSTGAKIQPGETLLYGYWLVKFEKGPTGFLETWALEPQGSDFVPGGFLALSYYSRQMEVCDRNGAQFAPPRFNQLTVVSAGVLEGDPVEAVRYPSPDHMSGWWITTDRYDDDIKSLKNEHTYHLTAVRDDLAPLLALPSGFRFATAAGGDRRVWFDEKVACEPVV